FYAFLHSVIARLTTFGATRHGSSAARALHGDAVADSSISSEWCRVCASVIVHSLLPRSSTAASSSLGITDTLYRRQDLLICNQEQPPFFVLQPSPSGAAFCVWTLFQGAPKASGAQERGRMKRTPKAAQIPRDWRLSFLWRPSGASGIPEDAVPGGEEDGRTTYVGRVEYEGNEIPGKVVPDDACYVAYAGAELRLEKYSVLVNHGNRLQWILDSDGAVPPKAVVGGRTRSGEKLYVGRTHHEGSLVLGKVQPSQGCLCIPYGGSEHRYTKYEVLVTDSIQPIG
ncbi:hypothetical protein V5799_032174, partial [Amblyomma americanum]